MRSEEKGLLSAWSKGPDWLALFARFARIPPPKPFKQDCRADLNEGTVQEICVESEALAIGLESKDEGPVYFLKMDAGHVLSLRGNWLLDSSIIQGLNGDMVEQMCSKEWFSRFTLRRSPRAGIVFSLLPEGLDRTKGSLFIKSANFSVLPESAILRVGFEKLPTLVQNIGPDYAWGEAQ